MQRQKPDVQEAFPLPCLKDTIEQAACQGKESWNPFIKKAWCCMSRSLASACVSRLRLALLCAMAGVLSPPTLLTTPRVVGRKRFAQARHTAASAHACPAALEWKMLRGTRVPRHLLSTLPLGNINKGNSLVTNMYPATYLKYIR